MANVSERRIKEICDEEKSTDNWTNSFDHEAPNIGKHTTPDKADAPFSNTIDVGPSGMDKGRATEREDLELGSYAP